MIYLKEFEGRKLNVENKDEEVDEFDPEKHNHVFYGQAFKLNKFDDDKFLVCSTQKKKFIFTEHTHKHFYLFNQEIV